MVSENCLATNVINARESLLNISNDTRRFKMLARKFEISEDFEYL